MNPVEARVERIATSARSVLDRIEQGERLSNVLAPARTVFDMINDRVRVHWLECEMYGLPDVPFADRPRKDSSESAGVLLFMEMRSVQDVGSLTVDDVVARFPNDDSEGNRGRVLHFSLGQVEDQVEAHQSNPPERWAPNADVLLQAQVLQNERERILKRVRDYLYQELSKTWIQWSEEMDNLKLLGSDYRLVIDNLEALETGVGDELKSALRALHDNNPASWDAAALTCRNLVMKLGRTLLMSNTDKYHSAMLNRELALGGDKEKNRLTAYIDIHWGRARPEERAELANAATLVEQIYVTGSKGKRGVRYTEAQKLVVDSFQLVASLVACTGLVPVTL